MGIAESKGAIRRVDDPMLQQRVLEAQRGQREISCRFDRDLRILAISG